MIGSGNGLGLNRWQVITWVNDGTVQWRIYTTPVPSDLDNYVSNTNGYEIVPAIDPDNLTAGGTYIIAVTSYSAQSRLKSPASRLFT